MILAIRHYPDPCLRKPALPVERIDPQLRELARDMIETMRDANGVGLAAPQIGVSRRIVVVDLEPDNHRPVVLINPVLIHLSREKLVCDEGCLSFPGVGAKLARSARAAVSALDLDGAVVEYEAEGLIARAFQHELDHLDGLVFVEKLAPTARRAIRDELAAMTDDFLHRQQAGLALPEGPVPKPAPPPPDAGGDAPAGDTGGKSPANRNGNDE